MKRIAIGLLLGVSGMAAWQAAAALQNEVAPAPESVIDNSSATAPQPGPAHVAPPRPRAPVPAGTRVATPMAQRIAVLGVLNKRNGVSRDIRLHPGQAVRLGDLI